MHFTKATGSGERKQLTFLSPSRQYNHTDTISNNKSYSIQFVGTMKRQLLSLSVLLTVTLSAALNDAFHARNGVSSALKSTNAHKPLPMDESVFHGVVDQEER